MGIVGQCACVAPHITTVWAEVGASYMALGCAILLLRTTCTTIFETPPPGRRNDAISRLDSVRSLLARGRAVLHELDGATPDVPASHVLMGDSAATGTYLITPTT